MKKKNKTDKKKKYSKLLKRVQDAQKKPERLT